MLILAIDTTALTASVAVADFDGETLKSHSVFSVKNALTHSETLFPMIDSALKIFGKSINEIDLFAVSAGPGSFTGVRIGVAAIKGLSFEGKPCAAVSTLEALAENIGGDGLICPLMDARRNVFYNALFVRENGELKRLTTDRPISLEELKEEMSAFESVRICGDGTALFIKNYDGEVKVTAPSPAERDQNALSVAKCAAKAFAKGEVITASELKPIYLRKAQAEREREERLAKTAQDKNN